MSVNMRPLAFVLCRVATLLAVVPMTTVILRAQSSCATGQTCTATFDGEIYTVIGPCDMSSITSISGCSVIGITPVTVTPPTNPSCNGDQILCGAPTAIVQDFSQTATQPLEQEAKAHVASLRGIANDTLNDFWSRGEIRAYMYLRILGMANSTTPLSSEDQAVVTYYTNAANNAFLTMANTAMALYNQWNSNPCGFQLPAGVGSDPNAYVESQMGTTLAPGPCALAQIPNNPACLLGQCIPPPPSAAQFISWATGAILAKDISDWGTLLSAESGIIFQATTNPAQTALQVAQGSADFEYDAAFGGLAEGVEYLTAKHAAIANVSSNTETTVESDFQREWLDGLRDFAGDQFRDVVVSALQGVFKASTEAGSEGTLAQTFSVETPFTQAEEELGLVAEEDIGDLIAEGWDTLIGPGIAAAAVIAVESWQQSQNADVVTQLQLAVCFASAGRQYSSRCTAGPGTLSGYVGNSNGRALLFDVFMKSTMPDFSVTRLASSYGLPPAAGPVSTSDPSFLQSGATTPSATFSSVDWSGNSDVTSVASGWFVQSATVNGSPSQLTYIPSVAYVTPNSQCTTTPSGATCQPLNPEGWRAWLAGNKFLAQREFVQAGSGSVQDATNGCPSILLPTNNVDLGAICVTGNFPFQIQAHDEVSIEGQVRTVASVVSSSGTVTSFQTTEPFDNDATGNLPTNQTVLVLANPDGNCLTSSSLGSRVTGPDCTQGSTISTSQGIVTIVPPATVHFALAGLTKTYGDPPFSVAAFVTSNSSGAFTFSVGSGSAGCTVDPSGNVTVTGAGTCVLNVAEAGAGTYGASTSNIASFTIAPAPLQVTASSPTITYGASATINPIYSGFVNGDTATSVANPPACFVSGASGPFAAGSYTTSCLDPGLTCTGPLSGPLSCRSNLSPNYTPTFANGVLKVMPAPLIVTASSSSITYGAAIPVITPAYSGFENGDSANSLTAKPTCSTTAANSVGTYSSSCSGAADPNYAVTYMGGVVTISKALLTVTANPASMFFLQPLPAFSAAFSGFVGSDTAAVLSGTPSLMTTATSLTLPGTYPIAAAQGTLSAANYAFQFVNGVLTINPTGAAPVSGSTCNGAYTGTFNGNLTVSAGQDCVFISGGANGNVTQTGGSLTMIAGTVRGNIQIQGNSTFSLSGPLTIQGDLQIQNLPSSSAQNQVCGVQIGNNLQYLNNAAPVEIGAGPSCSGNAVNGNLQVQNDTAAVSISGNQVSGNLQVISNTSSVTTASNTVGGNLQVQNNLGSSVVTANSVSNNLQCSGNASTSGGGNTARQKQGQCAAF